MRCLLCNAEMTLMNVVQDDTMLVAGFEHHTFMCSSCHDIEQRLVFVRAEKPLPATSPLPPSSESERADLAVVH